jgi:DNA-binding transcriptional ArsR family regulator
MARALAHPTRRRALQILSDRVASPREIAEELGEPLGRVSHHVRWLTAHGYLQLVRTEPRRGAREHFYRAARRPMFSDASWSELPAAARRELGEALLQDLWAEALDAAEAGALTAADVHLSRTSLTLDERGRRELSDALEQLVELALRVQDESARRLQDRPGRRSELALLHFDRAGRSDARLTGR